MKRDVRLRSEQDAVERVRVPARRDEVPVEEHNEYVKQLAIFKRRNDMLKLGLRETLSAALWNRVKLLHTAAEIWSALEL